MDDGIPGSEHETDDAIETETITQKEENASRL